MQRGEFFKDERGKPINHLTQEGCNVVENNRVQTENGSGSGPGTTN